MANFVTLQKKISRKLQDPNNTAISLGVVGDALNDAIRFWGQQRFWFNEAMASIPLTVGNPLLPSLPEDFLYPLADDGLVIRDHAVSYSLRKITPLAWDSRNRGSSGRPAYYIFRNGGYWLYPYPDLPYLLNLYYLKNYPPLVNDTDGNDFTAFADALILYETLSRLVGEDRQDLAMQNSYAAKADREYKNLLSRTGKQIETGRLHVDSCLHGRF